MKKLKNNFTTPEQSKRLLGFGLPADSADCYTTTNNGRAVVLNLFFSEFMKNVVSGGFNNPDAYLPCWSAGRLIEIFEKCTGERFSREIDDSTIQLKPLIEDVIAQIEKHLKMIYRRLDISKLYE